MTTASPTSPTRKAHRRGRGEGGIRQRSDGRWEGAIDLGYVDGKRKRKFVYGRTRQDVASKMRREQQRVESGLAPTVRRVTVADQLGLWLASRRSMDLSPNTIESDEWAAAHILPTLGRVRLVDLTPQDVDDLLRAKAGADLSRSCVRRIRNALVAALRHAERHGLVVRNVAALSELPKCKPPVEREALDADQARAFLAASSSERLGALIACGLMLGLRPGELTGLLWEGIDLTSRRLTVDGSLKQEKGTLRRGPVKRSRAGVRTIDLPAVLVDLLIGHRARQAQERLAAGPLWQDHGLVFATEIGTPLDPANLRRTYRRVGVRAGIGPVVPYQGRHTAATLLLDAGLSIEEAADVLGDLPETVYRHYRHRVRPTIDAAVGPMQQLFGGTA